MPQNLPLHLSTGNSPSLIANAKPPNDRATRIFRRLKRCRGMDDHERWQHALFFAIARLY